MNPSFIIRGTLALRKAFVEEMGLKTFSRDILEGYDCLYFYKYGSHNELIVQGCSNLRSAKHDFKLAKDWDDAVSYIKTILRDKIDPATIKEGDYVVVLPEDENYYNCEKDLTGKAIPQRVRTSMDSGGWIRLDFSDGTVNCYNLVRLATPEEMERFTEAPKVISGYSLEKRNKKIGYGCQKFTAQEIDVLIEAVKISARLRRFNFKMEGARVCIGDAELSIPNLEYLKKQIE